MGPGVFCVWSRADPDADTASPDQEDEGLFTDEITSLQGVSRGIRFARGEAQPTQAPFTHEVPFLTMYELPDVAFSEEVAFKEAAAQCSFQENDHFRPRVYEQIECIEAEEFKGDTVVGELVAVVTGEGFAEDIEEEFWKFHREEFVGSFMQAPEFIRGQVFKMVGDVPPNIKTVVPTGPYMFIYHWDCTEVPWSEVVAAAQTKGYVRHIESGIKWQGLNYHPVRFSEVQPPRAHRDLGSGYDSNEEEEELDGTAQSESADASGLAAHDSRDIRPTSAMPTDTEVEETKHQLTEDLASKANGDSTAQESYSRVGDRRIEEPRKNGADIATTSRTPAQSDSDFMSLNGAVQALTIEKEPSTNNPGQNHHCSAVAGAEAESSEVFGSVSVAEKIRAWEKNAVS